VLCAAFCGCRNATDVNYTEMDYSNPGNWVYINYGEDKPADCFFIDGFGFEKEAPKSLDDMLRNDITNDVNKQMGMYTDNCRFFAPFYRENYAENGVTDYNDIKSSFEYYMKNYNDGRPIVLASSSVGGEELLKLLKDELDTFSDRFVAAYDIGGYVTENDIKDYPQIVTAQQSDDVGVLVSFISENKYKKLTELDNTIEKAVSINPLDWTTENTAIDESFNMGACFFDGDGNMTDEVYQFCGAAIDEEKGALKLTGADYEDYATEYGDYEYMFFYRNIQYNVAERVEAFFGDDN
jgi:hypothetical protein